MEVNAVELLNKLIYAMAGSSGPHTLGVLVVFFKAKHAI